MADSEAHGAEKVHCPSGVAEFEERRQAENEKIRRAIAATDFVLATAEFWERRQAEFEKYAASYADLAVHWRASRGWFLWWGETPEGIEVPKECEIAFNVLARKALGGVPQLASLDREPWQVWLEFMHYRGWPFEITTIIPGNVERVWESAVQDGRTVWKFRDEVKYAKHEPDKWQYGLLLKRIFLASALFCLELSARAATKRPPDQPETPAKTPARVSLQAELNEAESRTADPKLQKRLLAVVRYNHYFEDLRMLKAACKRYQTPALLEVEYPDIDVWAAMDNQDKADVASGDFRPGITAWSLVKRFYGLCGRGDRTLKNYRRALRAAGLI